MVESFREIFFRRSRHKDSHCTAALSKMENTILSARFKRFTYLPHPSLIIRFLVFLDIHLSCRFLAFLSNSSILPWCHRPDAETIEIFGRGNVFKAKDRIIPSSTFIFGIQTKDDFGCHDSLLRSPLLNASFWLFVDMILRGGLTRCRA